MTAFVSSEEARPDHGIENRFHHNAVMCGIIIAPLGIKFKNLLEIRKWNGNSRMRANSSSTRSFWWYTAQGFYIHYQTSASG